MAPPKKVALKSIKTLTLHKDGSTTARRTTPIAQLTCNGKACRRFQPEVVQCLNMGDDGTGLVQWRCDADLPTGIRFGKLDVSCEGYSRPGDTNVLQGSCGLTYDLITINPTLERPGSSSSFGSIVPSRPNDLVSTLLSILTYILGMYTVFLLVRNIARYITGRPGMWSDPFGRGGGGGGGGGGPGFGGGGGGGAQPPPPPPYTKLAESSRAFPPGGVPAGAAAGERPAEAGAGTAWPGFWTGLAAGGAAYHLLNRGGGRQQQQQQGQRPRTRVDWEDYDSGSSSAFAGPSGSGGAGGAGGGGGGGGAGGMRRATGFGSTSTR